MTSYLKSACSRFFSKLMLILELKYKVAMSSISIQHVDNINVYNCCRRCCCNESRAGNDRQRSRSTHRRMSAEEWAQHFTIQNAHMHNRVPSTPFAAASGMVAPVSPGARTVN